MLHSTQIGTKIKQFRTFHFTLFYYILLGLAICQPILTQAQYVYSTPYTFTTLAGLPAHTGTNDGTGSAANFRGPDGLTIGPDGNLYVTDSSNNTIRKVTPAGVVTTLAGLGGTTDLFAIVDGTGSAARFNLPVGIVADTNGNLYVADAGDNAIRKVTTSGVVTTIAGQHNAGSADGTNGAAQFNSPSGIALDSGGNIYVADYDNHTIREIMTVGTNWVVKTLAGLAGSQGSADGLGSTARFYHPSGVAVDNGGNIYVADWSNQIIRRMTPSGTNWNVATLAGLAGSPGRMDGTGSAARFYGPSSVTLDSEGNIYVTDSNNSTIRLITPVGTNWVVTTLAGLAGNIGTTDGTGKNARFFGSYGATIDSAGDLYVADTQNSTIRKGFPANSVPSPMLQSPALTSGQFGFGITGLVNLSVNIQSSTDLTNWQIISTNIILTNGTNYFTTTNQPPSPQFYRVQVR